MRGNILISLLLTGLLFTTGCVPEFKNPLPAPKVMKADPALIGTWVSEPDKAGNISQVSFFERKSGWIDIVFIDVSGRYDGADVSIFEAYSTNVNKDTFLCFRPRKQDLQDQKNKESTYMLAYYQVSQRGVLNVNLFDQDAVEGMIEKGLLKGEFKEVNGKKELIKVVSSSDEIASVIAKYGVESLLSKKDNVKFRKLKL